MSKAKIVHIVDDDPAIRDSLGLLLKNDGFEVQTHASARDFLDAVGPDESGCVVTDVRMPGMSGFGLMAKMRERRVALPIIIITAHADVPLAVQAMKEGAVDLLEKPFDDDALLASVRQAMMARDGDETRDAEKKAIHARLSTLTGRENEVLAGLLDGQPNKVIARDLGISVRTVEVHRANVMTKMQAGSLSELVRMSLAVQRADRG